MSIIRIQGIVIGRRVRYRLIDWRRRFKGRRRSRSFICRKLRRMRLRVLNCKKNFRFSSLWIKITSFQKLRFWLVISSR